MPTVPPENEPTKPGVVEKAAKAAETANKARKVAQATSTAVSATATAVTSPITWIAALVVALKLIMENRNQLSNALRIIRKPTSQQIRTLSTLKLLLNKSI